MPLTNYEKQVRHRAKVKLKLARLDRFEAVLQEMADTNPALAHPASYYLAIARNALNAEAEA